MVQQTIGADFFFSFHHDAFSFSLDSRLLTQFLMPRAGPIHSHRATQIWVDCLEIECCVSLIAKTVQLQVVAEVVASLQSVAR